MEGGREEGRMRERESACLLEGRKHEEEEVWQYILHEVGMDMYVGR